MIEAAGATLLNLPPYSPDFNPIEMAFSKLRALLRKAAERTIPALWDAIGRLIDLVAPQDVANFLPQQDTSRFNISRKRSNG